MMRFYRLHEIIGSAACGRHRPEAQEPAAKNKRTRRMGTDSPPMIPISRSAWYAGIKKGKYPKPVKLAERTAVWRSDEIDELVQRFAGEA